MTREEIIQAIAITSGFAGIKEFEYCESIHCMTLFIKWYKNDISFCSQEGKELGEKVISFLNNKMNNNKTNKTNNINNKTNNKMKNNNLNNTNCNSKNTNYHKLISVSLEEAKEWYNSDNDILKALVLKAFSKEELENTFENIKSFEDACKVMKLDYNNMFRIADEIAIISKASSAMFKLNIIRKALNLNQDLHLTKGSHLYYPYNPIKTIISNYYEKELISNKMEIIGEIKDEEVRYDVLGGSFYGNKIYNNVTGLSAFESNLGIAFTISDFAFLSCATEEIAKHFGKYFGMLITEAKYGDIPGFEIVTTKYNF